MESTNTAMASTDTAFVGRRAVVARPFFFGMSMVASRVSSTAQVDDGGGARGRAVILGERRVGRARARVARGCAGMEGD